jgi:hypothetical protein
LRVVLYVAFHDGRFRPLLLGSTLARGLAADAATSLVVGTPLVFALMAARMAWLEKPIWRGAFLAVLYGGLFAHTLVELFFFASFGARFDDVAVEALRSPTEAVLRLWGAYDVLGFAAYALGFGAVLAAIASDALRTASFDGPPFATRSRAGLCAATMSASALLVLAVGLPDPPFTSKVDDEIARNGTVQLAHACIERILAAPIDAESLRADDTR